MLIDKLTEIENLCLELAEAEAMTGHKPVIFDAELGHICSLPPTAYASLLISVRSYKASIETDKYKLAARRVACINEIKRIQGEILKELK